MARHVLESRLRQWPARLSRYSTICAAYFCVSAGVSANWRAMFASNYPVDSLRASYDATYGLFDEATHALSTEERRALFHDNAVRIYRME